jgi:hypothetical protein
VTPVDVAVAQESFQTPLDVRYIDGRDWMILAPFVYVSPRVTVFIPKGFRTDFASIPRCLWRVLSPTELHIGKPAVVHDFLYRVATMPVTRKMADEELREAMKCVGAPWWKREMVYRGVRAGGAHAFVPRVGNHA